MGVVAVAPTQISVSEGSTGNSSVTGDNNTINGDITAVVDTMGRPSVEVWVAGTGESGKNTSEAAVKTESVGSVTYENGTQAGVLSTGDLKGQGTNTKVTSTVWSGILDDIQEALSAMEAQASGVGDVHVESNGQNVLIIDGEAHPDSNLESSQSASGSGGTVSMASLAEQHKLTIEGLISQMVASSYAQGTNSASASAQGKQEKYNGESTNFLQLQCRIVWLLYVSEVETDALSSGTGHGSVNVGASSAIDRNDTAGFHEAGVNSYGVVESTGNSSLLTSAQANDNNSTATVSGDANVSLGTGNSTVNGSNTVVVSNAGVVAEGSGTAKGTGTDNSIVIVNGVNTDDTHGETSVLSGAEVESMGNKDGTVETSVNTAYTAGDGKAQVHTAGDAKSDNGTAAMKADSQAMFANSSMTNHAQGLAEGIASGDKANTSNENFLKVDNNQAYGSSESESSSGGANNSTAESEARLDLNGYFAGARNLSAGGVASASGDKVLTLSRSRTDDFGGINNIISKHTASAGGSGTSSLQLNGYAKKEDK